MRKMRVDNNISQLTLIIENTFNDLDWTGTVVAHARSLEMVSRREMRVHWIPNEF